MCLSMPHALFFHDDAMAACAFSCRLALASCLVGYHADISILSVPARSQTIILIGVILLTANTASTYYNWVIFYAFAQFIFGFGIGGEYPVSRRRLLHRAE